MALDNFAANIKSIINRIGRDVSLRSYVNSGPEFNPTRIATDVVIKSVVMSYSANEADGSVIQRDDKEFLISSAVAVTKQHKIIDGGKEYQIVSLEALATGDDVLLYIAQGRA